MKKISTKVSVFFKHSYRSLCPFWLPFILLSCFCFSLPDKVKAQSIVWEKTFGGRIYQGDELNNYGRSRLGTVINTPDGGQLIGGHSDANPGFDKSQAPQGKFDYWLVKTDVNGMKQWDKVLGGFGQEDFTSVIATPDGGYLVGGISDSPVTADKSAASKGGYDYWVVKLDSTGTKIWDKTIGGTNYDQLKALINTPDGGFLLAGSSNSGKGGDKTQASNGNNDYWVVKIDSSGTLQWDKTFGSANPDYLVNLVSTSDGNYLLAGETDSVTYERDGSRLTVKARNFNVLKIDVNGVEQWNKTFYKEYNTPLKAFVTTPDGNYLLAGSNYLLKINENGIQLYEKNISNFLQANKALEAVIATPDGGYLLGTNGSYTNDNQETNRQDDFRLVKLNNNGDFMWDSPYGGNGFDFLTDLTLAADGNYVVGGYTSWSDGIDKTNGIKGEFDYWVLKVKEDQEPDLITWNQRFGGTDQDNLTQVMQTLDGGYLLGGYSLSGNNGDKAQIKQGGYDYWVIKTDDAGNKLWERSYGSAGNDYLNSIVQTLDGGYLLGGSSETGSSGDKTEGGQGGRDFWVIRIDYKGDVLWNRTYGGNGSEDLRKLQAIPTGGYLLAGGSNSAVGGDKSQASQGEQDYWVVRINDQGQKIWDQRYGGSANDNLADIIWNKDGSFLIGGTSHSRKSGNKSQSNQGGSDFWVIKADSAGQALWDKRFGGSEQDNLYAVASTRNGDFLLAGHSSSGASGNKTQPNQGNQDYWLLKINSLGEIIWDKTYGGRSKEELRSLTVTKAGEYVLGGTSFSGKNGDKTQNSRGGSDYWLVKTDSTGAQLADYRFGGTGQDELRTVKQTQEGGLILGGRSASGVSGDKSQPGWGKIDYWLVKISPASVATEVLALPVSKPLVTDVKMEETLNVYPNPFSEKLTLQVKVKHTQPASVRVYDHQGLAMATLYEGDLQAAKPYEWQWQPPATVPAGLYILRLQTTNQVRYRKVVLAR